MRVSMGLKGATFAARVSERQFSPPQQPMDFSPRREHSEGCSSPENVLHYDAPAGSNSSPSKHVTLGATFPDKPHEHVGFPGRRLLRKFRVRLKRVERVSEASPDRSYAGGGRMAGQHRSSE